MIAAVRKQKILDVVLEKKSATVVELARMFNVTNETIRRDLTDLEKQGKLKRSYGGAFVQTGIGNLVATDVRAEAYVDSKTAIAQICRHFIHNGDAIFLDNSTTAFFVAKAIQGMRLTVLTNNLMIVNLLAKSGSIHLVCTGGDYANEEKAFSGNGAIRMLENYYVDASFLSCRSLSLEHGVTDSTEIWTAMRQQIIRRSAKNFIIADYTKFDQTSYTYICNFNSVYAVVTDRPLNETWRSSLAEQGCILIDGQHTLETLVRERPDLVVED